LKVIIAGTRTLYVPLEYVGRCVKESGFAITEVVCGKAKGIDSCGEAWAKEKGIPVTPFPADWDKWGLAAGQRRNKQMQEYADALVLIWTGDAKRSPGSAGMKRLMGLARKPVHEVIVNED